MTVACALRIALATVVIATNTPVDAGAVARSAVKNIVLVHGVGTDGSGWRSVYISQPGAVAGIIEKAAHVAGENP